MLEHITAAPPDAILGLTEAFKLDAHPHKINLGAGVFVDEQGRTPILASVKAAEAALLATATTKSYMPIAGDPQYRRLVQELVFGADHPALAAGRVQTAHTPGGTAASPEDFGAVAKSMKGSNRNKCDVVQLQGLKGILETGGGAGVAGTFGLQKFIWFSGPRANIVRCAWRPSRRDARVFIITNKVRARESGVRWAACLLSIIIYSPVAFIPPAMHAD